MSERIITAQIFDQIMMVRDTGKTNMLDTNAVQRIAYEMDLYELVCLIEENKQAYASFILTGDRGIKEGGVDNGSDL